MLTNARKIEMRETGVYVRASVGQCTNDVRATLFSSNMHGRLTILGLGVDIRAMLYQFFDRRGMATLRRRMERCESMFGDGVDVCFRCE